MDKTDVIMDLEEGVSSEIGESLAIGVCFISREDGEAQMFLSEEIWQDIGEPDSVTMTIEGRD